MPHVILSVEGLSVELPTDDGVVHAVRDVSFTVEAGQVLGIVGESGAGKSMTALAVMGLLPSWAEVGGSVRLRGRELVGATDKQMAAVRGQGMAMVFQDPTTALNPVHTVGRHLVDAVRAHQQVTRKQAHELAVELLHTVGIPEPARRAGSYPHEFSGGMRQRVLIAMALANDPYVIIADEPTTALDVTVQAQVLETLEKVRLETNTAVVLITHDLGVVARTADRVLVMYAGRGVETGPIDAVYQRPRMPYTAALLASVPHPSGDTITGEKARLTSIEGTPPSLADLPPGCPFWPRCPMFRDECRQHEPELRTVDGPDHRAACHFSEELAPAR